jgi:hypothetical protein
MSKERRASGPPPEPRPVTPGRTAALVAGGVTLGTAAVIGFAFDPARAGQASALAAIGVFYALLTAAALIRLKRRGELRRVMRPAAGDLTFGFISALLLYGAAMAAQLTITPRGTPREAWIVLIYLQIGDPAKVNLHLLGGVIFLIAALEEITWRGLVMRALRSSLGPQRAWLMTTILFGAAHLPVTFLLRDPIAGLNPLIPLAAAGCGFIWGYLANRTGRMAPAIFSHALFTWAVIEFPLWRPAIAGWLR